MEEDEPVVVDDLRTETRFSGPPLLREHGVVSGLSVVITGGEGAPYGVLGAHTRRHVRFTDDDVHFIQAVANVLGEAIAREQAEAALRASEERYRLLVEQASDAIFVADLDGRYVEVNTGACRLLGYEREELIGTAITDVLPPDEHAHLAQARERLRDSGGAEIEEWVMLRKDGTHVPVEISAKILPDGRWQAIVRNITSRKEAEEQLRSEYTFRQAIEASMPSGVAATDPAGRQIYVNPAFCEMVGFTEDELIGQQAPFAYWPPEEYEAIQAALEATLRGEAPAAGFELCFMRKGGARFEVLVKVSPLLGADGAVDGFLASVTDVSERRKAEDRNRFQAGILTQINDGVIAYDPTPERRVTYLNEPFAELIGVQVDEAVGRPYKELYDFRWLDPGDADRSAAALGEGGSWRGEVVIVRKDGQELFADFNVSVLTDEEGRETGRLAVVRDVTERKRGEQRTRLLAEAGTALADALDYEATLQAVADLAVPALADWCALAIQDADGTIRQVAVAHTDPDKVALAHSLQERYPTPPDALHGVPHVIRTGESEFTPEIDAALLRAAAQDEEHLRILDGLGLRSAMVVPLMARGRACGALTLVMEEGQRQFTPDDLALAEELARRCGLAVDNARLYREAQSEIAERRRAQAALRESEQMLRFTLDAARVGTWNFDLRTGAVEWSDNLEAIHRMEPGAFDGTFEAFLEDVLPEDRAYVREQIEHAIERGGDYYVEYRLAPKEGAEGTVWVEGKGTVVFEDGEAVQMAGICMDITGRKRAEEALRESERRYWSIFESAAVSIWVEDFSEVKAAVDALRADGVTDFARYLDEHPEFVERAIGMVKILDVNEATVRLFGAESKEEMLASLHTIFLPETLDAFREELLALATGQPFLASEAPLKTLQGERLDVVFTMAFPVETGDYSRVLVSLLDNTDRKRAEAALRHNEERFRTLAETIPQQVWTADAGGQLTYVSDQVVRYFGRSRDVIVGDGWIDLVHPDDRDPTIARWADSLENGTPYEVEFRLRRADGAYRWHLGRAMPVRDDAGQTVSWFGTNTDISDNKRAEQELRDSMELFRQLVFTSPAALYTTDAEGRITLYNDRAVELWGREPVIGEERWSGAVRLFEPDGTPLPLDACPMAIALREQRGLRDQEVLIERPDGSRAHVLAYPEPLLDASGALVGAVNVLIDVTELKGIEAAVREKTRTLETVNRINRSLAAELDLDKLVQAVTDAGTELSGAQFGAFFYNVINERGEAYMLYALSGAPHKAFSRFPMPRNTAIFSPTFTGEGVVRLDDVTQDPRYGQNPPFEGMPEGHLPVRSYLAVPVVGRDDTVIGGLFFGHSEVGVFTEHSEVAVQGIAAQAAIAVENAGLYDQARRELAERKRAEALVSGQKQALELIAQGQPLAAVLEQLVTVIEEQAPGEILASILLLDEDGRHLRHGAAPSLPDAYNQAIDGVEIGDQVGSCGTAAFRGEPVVVVDIAEDPLWKDFKDLALEHDLRACWSTPILATQGDVLGTFALYYRHPTEPAAEHERLVSIMSRTASIAIERYRAERQVRELNETLEQRVVERTLALEAANARLTLEVGERKRAEHELERANTRLRQRNRELQDFAYAASHDLQEPLRKISAFSDLMRADFDDRLDENGRFYLDRMQNAALRMTSLITDLLAFSRIATQGRAFEEVDLNEIIEGVLSDLEVQVQESGARVEVAPLPTLEADPVQMRQLFQNLIGNAIKFRKADEPPVVHISGQVEAAGEAALVQLSVEDNGIGFAPKYADRIFSPFQRLHGRSKYPGTGIGLALCRRIAERHGGTIAAHGTPGEGARFVVTLPAHHDAPEDDSA
ncbi:MAG: PAS domain S-box protein [Rhodothermales bacterium]|nr:PAS domain S-box protein [Rhodothermales bacterium]